MVLLILKRLQLEHQDTFCSERPGRIPTCPFVEAVHREFLRFKTMRLNHQRVPSSWLIVRRKIETPRYFDPVSFPLHDADSSEGQLAKLRIQIKQQLFASLVHVG